MFKNSVLQIYIKGKPVVQGKFFMQGRKAVYIQNVDGAKWVRMVGGYAIAEQLLEAFSKAKLKVKIIFNIKEKAIAYSTNQTNLNKHGMPFAYGDHRQRALSIKWMKLEKDFNEPYNLPVMSVDSWLKNEPTKVIWDKEGFRVI
jgi:hypothetical protein